MMSKPTPEKKPDAALSSTMRIDLPPELLEPEEEPSAEARPPTGKHKKAIRIAMAGKKRATSAMGGQDFQELLLSVYDAALLTDTEGRIRDANPRAVKFLGVPRHVLTKRHILDVISGADKEVLRNIYQGLERNRFILVQGYCNREDGTLFPAEISINRLHLSTDNYLCFFVRDITLRKHTEERLRSGHTAIQNAGSGIAIASADAKLTFVNPALTHLLGYERAGQLLGRHLSAFTDEAEVVEQIVESIAAENNWLGEIECTRPDGKKIFIQVSAAPNMDEERQVTGMVLSFADMTDRRLAELQHQQFTRELERSNKALEQFAYVVSHDLQEPLRKITAFGDRLASRCRDDLPEAGKEYLDRMENAARRMRALIDALLALSRVSTTDKPFVRVDLNETVRGVLSDLETRIQRSGGEVVLADPLPVIEAEEVQMQQLFMNLIGNALKFHKDDTPPRVVISSKPLPATDLFATKALSGVVHEIVVADNGIGFESKFIDRMFGVFQRLHGRDTYEGTGIGLAICQRIVERHGGTIMATSEVNVGSKFIVQLPAFQSRDKDIGEGI